MDMENISIFIEDELSDQLDIEGIVIDPSNIQSGLLVMSSKDDTFTLHIYELQLNNGSEYQIIKELCVKTYTTLSEMITFLESLSTFKAEEFSDFFKKHK